MVKLDSSSLDWALRSIKEIGDNDLFPRSFEIDVIESQWSRIKSELLAKEFVFDRHRLNKEKKYHWIGGRRAIVPKGNLSYRFATQLDPIDSIVLTSLIYQYGNIIENSRINVNENKVFSYRFKPLGYYLYDTEVNWVRFWEISKEKAEQHEGYVLECDISDFYNQIYHHTLENELQKAGVPKEICSAIKDLMMTLTHGVSRGIPVGPVAVHLLGEVTLNSIDNSLKSHFYNYCRYIDDFHIYCRSKEEADIALYNLVNFLDINGRLVPQRYKISLIEHTEFIKKAEQKLTDAQLDEVESDIIKTILTHSSGDPYRTIFFTDLNEEEKKNFTQEAMTKLLKESLEIGDVDFIKIRWLLRRFSQIGMPGAISFLLRNMENLTPALAEVAMYLISTIDQFEGEWANIGSQLLKAMEIPLIKRCEYLQMILVNLFSKNPDLNHIEKILEKFPRTTSMVQRKIILVATKANFDHWLREKKYELDRYETWTKRAIIMGASIFPEDEKKFWLNRIIRDPKYTLLEKSVAEWVKQGGII